MREKKKKSEEGGAAEWALSFGDMMTLLLTFFILIVSFSTTELIKFRKAMGSLRGSMGVLLEQDGSSIIKKANTSFNKNPEKSILMQTIEAIEQMVFEAEIESGVDIEVSKETINFRISDKLLFNIGRSELNPDASLLLESIGLLIMLYSDNVRVEGHTDNIPIHTIQYPSNWELSIARAMSVVRFFVEQIRIDPTRINAVGCGEFKPILPNTSSENRARNRRVEIFLKLNTV